MKVTPLDLRQQRFKTAIRGFDRAEVTAFLSEAADDFEQILREQERLRQEIMRVEAILFLLLPLIPISELLSEAWRDERGDQQNP